MYFLGYDIGTSSVKASLIEADSGKLVASASFPEKEQAILSPQAGWAEQEPEMWWDSLKEATKKLRAKGFNTQKVLGIGIAYQMHGLVVVDRNLKPLRPSVIWCDSRAVEIGNKAFNELGADQCLTHLLNSPGNFTASKLKWVKENEPEVYEQIYKIMLPGDYIAMKLTGEVNTTITGLSEGTFWDFEKEDTADFLLDYYQLDKQLLADICPVFGDQGKVKPEVAEELGLAVGTKVCYRSGDQPNNALSLNVMKPGEIAATAGTSGVVYGISDELKYDQESRVNTFAHVNHTTQDRRLGILLCINGTGIQNSWMKNTAGGHLSYNEMNDAAAKIPVGAEGLQIFPFGNGAERMLSNRTLGASIHQLDFNKHTPAHLYRAAQEGIVFSFQYGISIMEEMGVKPSVIKAGKTNMFQSEVFTSTLSSVTGVPIELYDTDGSRGAAMGAAFGFGHHTSIDSIAESVACTGLVEPDLTNQAVYQEAYGSWKNQLETLLKNA
ncbi:FGGY family carbohydrate kinase [Limibacter armeniacum]|uniref:xylulokinase n=1 Tax=Limibacter armeniacum TaxID=466084 RepID=UPI002FE5D3D4